MIAVKLFLVVWLFTVALSRETIRNERDLVKIMRTLSACPNYEDFLSGLHELMHMKSSPKTRNFNGVLTNTRALVSPIEMETQKLLAQGKEMLKRRSPGNVADALEGDSSQNTAFRKEVDGLMEKLSQATSQAHKNLQKRKVTAVRNQLKKERAGLDYRSEQQAISIFDAFQSCLARLVRVPNDICHEILGSDRCQPGETYLNEAIVPPIDDYYVEVYEEEDITLEDY